MRRWLPIALIALGVAALAYLVRNKDIPSPSVQTIKEIEAQVVMPEGAHPLNRYLRYYAYGWKGWKIVVVGSYQFIPENVVVYAVSFGRKAEVPGVQGAYALAEPPKLIAAAEGDPCQFVFLHYDETTKRLLPIIKGDKQQVAWCGSQETLLQ